MFCCDFQVSEFRTGPNHSPNQQVSLGFILQTWPGSHAMWSKGLAAIAAGRCGSRGWPNCGSEGWNLSRQLYNRCQMYSLKNLKMFLTQSQKILLDPNTGGGFFIDGQLTSNYIHHSLRRMQFHRGIPAQVYPDYSVEPDGRFPPLVCIGNPFNA